VLEALEKQTLARQQWELLLIDNASKDPLAGSWDLSWHPHGRHIREDELGLTAARARGIKESQGEVLLFVDDDNVLDNDYLEHALTIANVFPQMGVWGGSITGVFEIDPPDFVKARAAYLAVGEVKVDAWGTSKSFSATCPPGAGVLVRKTIANAYQEKVKIDPFRRALGRRGEQLTCGEDIDLAWSACEMGYGMGRFKDLKLQHLISAKRLTLDYWEKFMEAGAYSMVFLLHFHSMTPPDANQTIWAKLRHLKQQLAASPPERKLEKAAWRGRRRGRAELEKVLANRAEQLSRSAPASTSALPERH
jgi:hypothetical protein